MEAAGTFYFKRKGGRVSLSSSHLCSMVVIYSSTFLFKKKKPSHKNKFMISRKCRTLVTPDIAPQSDCKSYKMFSKITKTFSTDKNKNRTVDSLPGVKMQP